MVKHPERMSRLKVIAAHVAVWGLVLAFALWFIEGAPNPFELGPAP